MAGFLSVSLLIQVSYFVAAFLFIMGLKRMSSPKTAASGIKWAGLGMVVATVITFAYPGMQGYVLMTAAIFIGGVLAWWTGKRVAMTDMPQMIALYNGMGGGAAGAIAAVELLRGEFHNETFLVLALIGALIGSVSFSGSLIAFAKLQGIMSGAPITFKGQHALNALIGVAIVALVVILIQSQSDGVFWALVGLSFLIGFLLIIPIGGADMPVIISMLNSYSGWAASATGFMLGNDLLIVTGALVGSSGAILSYIMCRAMNRKFLNVIAGGFGTGGGAAAKGSEDQGEVVPIEPLETAELLSNAKEVMIIPGYGMAVAQAQHIVHEITQALRAKKVNVRFGIHPVAGRMPGHMNVLLAEADIPYDDLIEMDEINPEMPQVDVVLVLGANDVVNPAAKNNPKSPIHGMPIIEADRAKTVLAVKRSMKPGFAGIDNELYTMDKTLMVFGDAKAVVGDMAKTLSGDSGMH